MSAGGALVGRDAVFVLGAVDPEMREIAKVLKREGWRHVHAARGGSPVGTRDAYDADGVVSLSRQGRPMPALLLPAEPVVFVECALRGRTPVARVDHHNPGDPGYEKPPAEYFEGSSLGQALRLIGVAPNETQRLLAAADHCLTAAYQGECPGIDPQELLFLRASWRARMSGRTLDEVVACIQGAADAVREQFDPCTGESRFLDPTVIPPELAEGAAVAGHPICYREFFRNGDLKEMLKGATPAHIERFMAGHRAAGRRVYGNPWRGYAGAYLA